MRIIAAYDAKGVIKAAAVIDGRKGLVLVPVAYKGTKVGEFDVPSPREGASELRLEEVCTTFRVDTRAQRLVNVKAAAPRRQKRR
jgi:hypothetical protein